MRIYIDLDTRLLLSTPNRSIRGLEFKRRDNDSLELQFVRNGTVVSVPSATTVQYGLKPVDQYASGFFSSGAFTKTGSGEAAVFTAIFTLNTQPIEQAFDLEPKSISAMLEIELRDGDTVASSVTLPVTIANDVIRGDEATPAAIPDGKASQAEAQAGTDNAKWMTPLRTKQAITQAAGSYAPATGILPSAISGTAVVNADPRLNDSRTPTAHKSSHAAGAVDALTPVDIGAVRGFEISGNPPDANIAPAAMELRDNEDSGGVALKCDGRLDNQWSVLFPTSFRAAIGAATAAQGAKADIALQAADLTPYRTASAQDTIDAGKASTSHKSSHATGGTDAITPADIGAAPAATDNAAVADGAMELWDNPNDTAALRISDNETFFYGRQNSSPQLNPDLQDTSLLNQHLDRQVLFCNAIGAATSAQGAKADSSLQQGAYISAASLEVGTIAAGQAPDLFVGSNGMVGIGTETCTEKLTVNGSIALSGGQIKNLGTPVDANDAVRKADLEAKFPTPPASGTYALKSVDGVVSWVEE